MEEDGHFYFPEQFKCPFTECSVMCRTAEECATHVSEVKHPKRTPRDSPQWVCVGR